MVTQKTELTWMITGDSASAIIEEVNNLFNIETETWMPLSLKAVNQAWSSWDRDALAGVFIVGKGAEWLFLVWPREGTSLRGNFYQVSTIVM